MRLWIVNHPYDWRRWLKVEARVLGKRGWRQGYVWTEWFTSRPRKTVVEIPNLPTADSDVRNVDPLVIGRRMYFDYCKKTDPTTKRNDPARNQLQPGDLVFFNCRNRGQVIIDTVFAIGQTRDWTATGVPWPDLDLVAERVHFHAAAHDVQHPNVQHPEVRLSDPVRARSYQGAPPSGDGEMFCWVPFLDTPPISSTRPFVLHPNTRAYRLLCSAYRRRGETRSVIERWSRRFRVVDPAPQVTDLFAALLVEAEKRFEIAVEIRLLPNTAEVAYVTDAEGRCSPAKDGSGPHGTSRAKRVC